MFSPELLPYSSTGSFSSIVTDYLSGAEGLRPFYKHRPDLEGVKAAIAARKNFAQNRKILVTELEKQYSRVDMHEAVANNIARLANDNCFTVTTAHQPNLFTGPLYFIYKILHAIRISEYLNKELDQYEFVPVYYMGSEDADFAELNHTWVFGKKIEWTKEQGGAVGRMKVDASLLRLIDELSGQLLVEPHGAEVIDMLRNSYTTGVTIEQATFQLVNQLYGRFGLVVLIPDNPAFKGLLKAVFSQDIFHHQSEGIVKASSEKLDALYHSQAHARDVNLFYLLDHKRERITVTDGRYIVLNTDISFSAEELRKELEEHPERFSPNVILRGILQETILPNICFVGGGGELAYWLQLKDLFEHFSVPFPVLVLRNSFLIKDSKTAALQKKLGLSNETLFKKSDLILSEYVTAQDPGGLSLAGELDILEKFYMNVQHKAESIDASLKRHVIALKVKAASRIEALEKKMLRARKRRFSVEQEQILKLKNSLFPNDNLQERVENISGFYARYGHQFIDMLLQHSPAFEQRFTVLEELPQA